MQIYFDKLLYSPFEFSEFRQKFEKKGFRITRNLQRADLIMSSYLSVIKVHINKFGTKKKYLLWTHEPYHDWTLKSQITYKGARVQVMNCYTGDVFTHNLRYFYFRHQIPEIDFSTKSQSELLEPLIDLNSEKKPIVALSTYYNLSYYQGNPHTLFPKRYETIETGYQRGLVDVYGKGWKQHPIIQEMGNSRNNGDRRKSKEEILAEYSINLCLENTNFPYYISEKIWESIKNHCLPIYYSNETIYEILPKNSFIDVRDFENLNDLWDYLLKMTKQEYYERLNQCIKAFNQVIQDQKNNTWRGKSDNLNINYLEYQSCYECLLQRLEQMKKR